MGCQVCNGGIKMLYDFWLNINAVKKCAPKMIFFDGKKVRKIRLMFDIENRLFKSEFYNF